MVVHIERVDHPAHYGGADNPYEVIKVLRAWLTPDVYEDPRAMTKRWMRPHEHGNFIGWRQFRKTLRGESCAPLPEGYK